MGKNNVIKFGTILFLGLLPACNGGVGSDQRTVTGQVTLDGQPLKQGEVVFRAVDGSSSSAGQITAGRFAFPAKLGEQRVQISSTVVVEGQHGQVGGIEGDPVSTSNPAPVYRELIPEKYNSQSNITVEVTDKGKNDFVFEIISDKDQ